MTAMMIESPYTVPRPPTYRLVMKATHGKEELVVRGQNRLELLQLADQITGLGYWFAEMTRDG